MAQIYFSKFNINSLIYDMYEDDTVRVKVLNELFNRMDNEITYEEKVQSKDYQLERIEKYKFYNLEKDFNNKSITGRLVKIFKGEVQSYDEKNDTVNTEEKNDCAVSSTFYFDFNTEQIAFITKQGFGYNQFNRYFKILTERYFVTTQLCLQKKKKGV